MPNWVKRAWQYMRDFEPARAKAAWVALAGVAVTLGFGQTYANLNGGVQAVLTALAVILPLIQGEVTRAKVTPPGNLIASGPHADDQANNGGGAVVGPDVVGVPGIADNPGDPNDVG